MVQLLLMMVQCSVLSPQMIADVVEGRRCGSCLVAGVSGVVCVKIAGAEVVDEVVDVSDCRRRRRGRTGSCSRRRCRRSRSYPLAAAGWQSSSIVIETVCLHYPSPRRRGSLASQVLY